MEDFPVLNDNDIIAEVLQTEESYVGIDGEGDRDAAEDPDEEVRVSSSSSIAEVIQSFNLAQRWLEPVSRVVGAQDERQECAPSPDVFALRSERTT